MPLAALEDVVVTFGARTALAGLSATFEEGLVTALLGRNGAGKSTTVSVICGLRRPSAGRTEVLGGSPGRRDARERIGVMLQDGGLPSGAHAVEMVRHVAALRSQPKTADHWIEILGLSALGRTSIRRMSGGERRRVSLACALVGSPDAVILDEPTAGLDPQGRRIVWDIIAGLRRQETSVVLSTHLLEEAEALSDRVVILEAGHCVSSGTTSELAAGAAEALAFESAPGLSLADLQAALPRGSQVDERAPGRYVVSGHVDPSVLAAVTAWCAQQGLMPTNLSTGGRGLEEHFWKVTGYHGDDGTPS